MIQPFLWGQRYQKIKASIGKQRSNSAEVTYLDLDSTTEIVQNLSMKQKNTRLSNKKGALINSLNGRAKPVAEKQNTFSFTNDNYRLASETQDKNPVSLSDSRMDINAGKVTIPLGINSPDNFFKSKDTTKTEMLDLRPSISLEPIEASKQMDPIRLAKLLHENKKSKPV